MALKIFEDIKLVKGYNRSILLDYTNNTFEFFDSKLFDLLQELEKSNELTFNEFANNHPIYIEKLKEFYVKNIFNEFYNENVIFPKLSEDVDNPFAFQSVTIYVSNLTLPLLIDNIEQLCNLTANIFLIVDKEFIDVIINLVKKNTENGIRYVFCSEKLVLEFIKSKICNSVLAEYHIIDFNIVNNKKQYLETWPSLENNFFNFCESSSHNLGIFEKVLIDQSGNIKNNLHDDYTIDSFFNIDINNLEMIVKDNIHYKNIANVTVDKILVCRDCEFRRICVDITSVKSTKFSKNTYYKTKECNYNPYISKWKESSNYKSLKDCGVYVNEDAFSIDHEKIEEINKVLWCD